MTKGRVGGDEDTPPRPDVIRERIRFLAQDSGNVILTHHAMDRMEERDITSIMVFRILRGGSVKGDVTKGRKAGDWVVKMTGRVLGNRDVGVVTAVLKAGRLVVVTVEWEDLK